MNVVKSFLPSPVEAKHFNILITQVKCVKVKYALISSLLYEAAAVAAAAGMVSMICKFFR